MITAKGAGFLVAAIVVLLLARLTQVGWLYLMDAVLWGILALSAGFPWFGVSFLAARRSVKHPGSLPDGTGPAEGDPIQITIALRNRALWPSYVLSLFYECPQGWPGSRMQRFFVTEVTRSGQVSMVTTVEAYQRGMGHLGPVTAESSAPFGLFRRRVRLTAPRPILVYPRVYPLRRMALADGVSGVTPNSRKARTGTDPAGSRHYLPGDPRRHIHWRNTARTGRLMVKEFEDPRDPTLYLLFDATQVWEEGKETTLEYGIKVVASVADHARRNRVPIRIWGGGLRIKQAAVPAGGAPYHAPLAWPRVLRDLALVAQGDGQGLPENLSRLPWGSSALVAVCPDDTAAVQAIVRAASLLHRLVVVSLEGFSGSAADADAMEPLRQTGIPVIRCAPGKLEEALRALEMPDGRSFSMLRASSASHPRSRAGEPL